MAAATHLVFTTPPTSPVGVNGAWDMVTVQANDGAELRDGSYSGDVTISLSEGTGALSGTLTLTFESGTIDFPDLSYDTAESIKIRADSDTLTGIESGTIVVTPEALSATMDLQAAPATLAATATETRTVTMAAVASDATMAATAVETRLATIAMTASAATFASALTLDDPPASDQAPAAQGAIRLVQMGVIGRRGGGGRR